jgi:hypothetical protein
MRISEIEAEIERKRKRGIAPSQRDLVLREDALKQQEAALMYGQTSSPFSGALPQASATTSTSLIGQSQNLAKADHQHGIGTHTHADATTGGTVVAASVSDFNEAVDDRVDALIIDGEGIDTTYDDPNGTLTVAVELASSTNVGGASFSTDNFSVSAGGAVTIKDAGVVLAEMANMAVDTFIGRQTNSTGVPEAITIGEQTLVGRITGGHVDDLSVTQIKTLIGNVTTAVAGLCPTAPNDASKYLRGDATWDTVTPTIADDSITLAKIQNITNDTLIGSYTAAGAPHNPEEIAIAEGEFVGRITGGHIDGISFSAVYGYITPNIALDVLLGSRTAAGSPHQPEEIAVAEGRIVGRITGGHIDDLTANEVLGIIGQVSTSANGYCPAAPNDTAKFFRGDATWAALPAALGGFPLQPAADVVVNDTGGNFDVTFEGDTNATLLVLDAGFDVVSIGAAANDDGIIYGTLQVTAPATTHSISGHTGTAGYGIASYNSVAEGTTSGGAIAARGVITPSGTGKRIGVVALGAITTGTTYYNSVNISAFSAEAWDATHGGTYLSFLTTANAAVTRVESLRLGPGNMIGFFGTAATAQPAHIADASGGTVIDTQARAAIASINAALAILGLTAAA